MLATTLRDMNPDTPEAGTPQTVLLAKVRARLAKTPFEPFLIVTSSGRAYPVATADHAGVVPALRLIHVAHDDGSETDIHALHVAAIEPLRKRKRVA